jgi:hypothetical protein
MPRVCCTVLALALSLTLAAPGSAAPPDFDRAVAPLLVRRCLDCHSGPKPKGKLDLSRRQAALEMVTPGKPDDSPLWQRVHAGEMPPKKPLPEDERRLLRDWIAAGARWGSDPVDPFRITTEHRAGYDWWSLRPVQRPEPPAVHNKGWVRNPVDAFVLARLEAAQLEPAPEADRRTLIRRLSFDLLGLPPAPEEVEAFVRDAAPDAYEKLVERLLASPHHGERWARHWLDVVRFGESNGYERDQPRPNAWPYRDWVVDAFNHDLPYDEFVRLQLAGDVLHPGDPEAIKATGFLVAGPHDVVVPVVESMRASMRQDELEDIVGTVGQTFLGLTVNCARCHDHKFDPVSQKDYYRLAAALAGVQHGERELKPAAAAAGLARVRQRLEELGREIEAVDGPVRRQILAERHETTGGPASPARLPRAAPPKALAEWNFQAEGVRVALEAGARRERAGLVVDGKKAYARSEPLTVPLREKTLEAWVRLDDLRQAGGGVVSVETLDGNVFDAVVFAEKEPGRWMAGSNFFERTQSFGGPAEATADREFVQVALVYHADGTIAGYRNGRPYGKPYRSRGPVEFTPGQYRVVFGVRHEPAGGNRMLAGVIARARLYDRALSPDEVAAAAGVGMVSEAEVVARLDAGQRTLRQRLQAEAGRLAPELARLESATLGKVYAAVPGNPGVTHLLLRGEVTARGPELAPGGVAALPGGADFGLKPDAPEGERRLRLARWLTAADNPLFGRVIVNRLWHHHFGTGLVDTPNDLGFNGGRPSHPELLDYLAAELVRQRWSLKALHRTMVLSATYRQGARPNPTAARIDGGNRLLWRHSPQRLEAEAVRDSILAVTGQLDRTVGGRGYQDFRSYFFKGTQFYEPVEQTGPAFNRRTLYRMWARGGRSPFLDTFDCPDPSATAPRRAVTTTPLQALALLNNAFVLDQADRLAERLRREAGGDVEKQLTRAYRLAYGRPPENGELELPRRFVERHGLAAFCRVLFNSNEFVHVE